MVVDPVDAGEVVDRPAVDLSVGAEVVVEDGVGAHRLDAELVVGQPQRLTELGADRPARRVRPGLELAEMLGADHRTPWPLDGAGRLARHRPRPSPSPHRRSTAWPPTTSERGWSKSLTDAAAATR